MMRMLLLLTVCGFAAAAEPAAQPLGNLVPYVVVVLLALLVPAAILILSRVLSGDAGGAPAKQDAYECGIPQAQVIGSAGERFSVKFYLVAMLFLVFDVEVAFLYPFIVTYANGGWPLFGVLLVFLIMLEAGYLYLYRKGALDWER